MKRAVRQSVEAAIESLIALLDQIDGDADAEPEVEEPEVDSEIEGATLYCGEIVA